MSNMARTAAAIMRTDRTLSPGFRQTVALMIEALDECISEISMSEQVHQRAGQPFYSKGLDMGRAALSDSDTASTDAK